MAFAAWRQMPHDPRHSRQVKGEAPMLGETRFVGPDCGGRGSELCLDFERVMGGLQGR